MQVSLEWFFDNLITLELFAGDTTSQNEVEIARQMFRQELRRLDNEQ